MLAALDVTVVTAIVRHFMTFIGGVLVTQGIFDAGVVESLTGAVVTIAGVVWSMFNKVQVDEQLKGK
jgi:hypothetical protein